MSNTILQFLKTYRVWFLAAAFPIGIFLWVYPHYLRENTFFLLCLITLPLSVQRSAHQKGFPVFWLLLCIGGLSLLLPTTTGAYISLSLMLVMLLQSASGGLHPTILIHCALTSPFFTYFNSMVSFPVRLWLSRIVTYCLQTIGLDVQIDGNLVYMGETSFLVDEACAGMTMLGYGLLFGTIIISHLSKNKQVGLPQMTLFYLILLTLILSGNIVRISLLIIFNIRPDHWLHEGVGFCVYAFQVLIPFYLIIERLLMKQSPHQQETQSVVAPFPVHRYAIVLILLLVIITRHQLQHLQETDPHTIELSGFQKKEVQGKVIKLENEQALIYVKPPVPAYSADHNPMICWQGSGYSFQKIGQWSLFGTKINCAELVKKQDKVHTAWWYQSKNYATGDQLEWRKYGLLENEDFYLINVTCNSQEELKRQVQQLLNQNIIAQRYSISNGQE